MPSHFSFDGYAARVTCGGTSSNQRADAFRETWRREVDRCSAEIAAIEALLLAGHPDVEGLCLALSDWSAELRILEERSWKNESCSI